MLIAFNASKSKNQYTNHREHQNTGKRGAAAARCKMHQDPGDGPVGMKTDRIRMDITDITLVFIFLSGFGFEYG